MFIDTPLPRQIDRMRNDPLRVLVVGAGVAGLTLAQALRAGGLHPVLLERQPGHADDGYMLALMPLVDRAMRRLSVRRAYGHRSVRFRHYGLHGRHGQALRTYDIGSLLSRYGEYRGIARGDLMQVLADAGAPVAYASTVRSVQPASDAVQVVMCGGGVDVEAAFDVVVVADGLHSATREQVLPPQEVTWYRTGWGGWVAWADDDPGHEERGDEVWGADFFVGIYPVKGRSGVFVGGHGDDTRAGPRDFVAHVRRQLRQVDARIGQALARVEAARQPYYWTLDDCRSAAWATGRVVLLGDAAAGFLPTAGIGAAMAMESADVLAETLLAASREEVPSALQAYERCQRPRVEAAQDNSRQLARMMFHRSRALAAVRDVAARCISLRTALRPIRRLLDSRPE